MLGRWSEVWRVDVAIQRVHRHQRVEMLKFLEHLKVLLINLFLGVEVFRDSDRLPSQLVVLADAGKRSPFDVIFDRQLKQYPEQDRDSVGMLGETCLDFARGLG
jgi:hypothetical protein